MSMGYFIAGMVLIISGAMILPDGVWSDMQIIGGGVLLAWGIIKEKK